MPERSLKLAFCTDGIYPYKVGGMQRHSKLLIEHLASYKDLELIVLHPHVEVIFPYLENVSEIHITDIDKEKIYLLELYRYSRLVEKKLLEIDPDVIYSQGFSVWHGIDQFTDKLIINPHGLEPWQAISLKDRMIGLPFRIIQRYLFKRAAYTVALGGKLTEILKTIIPEDKIRVLPNAVDEPKPKINKLFPDPDDKSLLKVLFVGRFASNKGIHILMNAITELNKQGYEEKIEFHLAGKGPLYEEYISKYTFSNVKFWGFVSDEKLEQLYLKSHLFVLPTLFEGMPTVVLEAMSKQLPIIVTDIGATAEQVDTYNGFLIEKNSTDALVKALKLYYSLPTSKKVEMGVNSYYRIKNNFTWSKIAERHNELFKELSTN